MEDHLKEELIRFKQNKKETDVIFKKMKRVQKRKLDDFFHEAHADTFAQLDCLSCANCCKTTSPIVTDQDVKRLAKLFKMKSGEFIAQYLILDEEDDYVFPSAPCPFLNEDNTCFVYDVRPQACREYPHTNRKNMYQILNLTKKNTEICPAVVRIVKKFKVEK